jgi:hypothetical protein
MHGSELKDGQHSTPDEQDPRSKLWPKFLGAIALFGLLVGLMIGKVTEPEPRVLARIEIQPAGLVLWFNEEPRLHGEFHNGTLAIVFDAHGRPGAGQLPIDGRQANWKVQQGDQGLLLTVIAARPLQGDWSGSEVDGRWRFEVKVREAQAPDSP